MAVISNAVHIKIRDIGPGNDNLLLRGIVICKQEPRTIQTKKDNVVRCVLSFTLRDSPSDLINVNAWGSPNFIRSLHSEFQIGDIVDVSNVKAVFRKISNSDDLYQPSVTSSFYAVFNENKSQILINSSHTNEYLPLLNIPTKPPGNFLTISDIQKNGEKLNRQFVNLLAAVRDISLVRQFKSKDGRNFECRDVILIDQTYTTLSLTIWGSDLLKLSEKWIPKNTILFLADVRVEWNEYRQKIIVSTSSRTIITENPCIVKAENLKSFLTSTPFQATGKLDQIINKYPDPSIINMVMSCALVIAKSMDEKQNTEYTALVYAVLNSFDIDELDYFVVTKCLHCNWKVDPSLELCLNANCPTGTGNDSPNIDQIYDIRVTLLDHTGLLMNCRLTNDVAMKLIGCKATLFHTLSSEEKTSIKWNYLLKYCAVRLVALPIKEREMPIITILSLDLLSLSEYSSLIPIF